MWPEIVIVSTLLLCLCLCVVKDHKLVGVQALDTGIAIKTTDVCVVRRLTRPREVEL